MSSVGKSFMERGTFIPRIVRDNGFCLTCRRSGKQCDSRLPTCDACRMNGLRCIQPISAYPRVRREIRQRRRISPEPEEVFRAETRPQSEVEVETVVDSEAETEILTPFAFDTQPRSAVQSPPPQPNENDENATSGPGRSMILNDVSREIDQGQQRLLRQTPGHIPLPASLPSGPVVDQDHDYAVYYDYEYDFDSDDSAIDGSEGSGRRTRSHTPYTLESTSRTSTVYQVKNTWTGKGPVPLERLLRDYIYYMKECHLSHAPSDALPLVFLPASEPTAAEMLRYYVLRPTNRSTNPLPDINPPNPRVIDLAYSNPLVLQLIIAERADHREVSSATLPTGQRAERFFRAAINSFAPKIRNYLAGNEEDMLCLTIGSLIISLTEKARQDKRGQAHNYPSAATSVIVQLNTSTHKELCESLPDILVEYYMHTSMFACLAADVTKVKKIPFMSDAFRGAVNKLNDNNYKGKLCGTWLRIMLSIHSIFELGMEMKIFADASSNSPKPPPLSGYVPSYFATFDRIQHRLDAFRPAMGEYGTNFEAAILWKTAATLYQYSLLEWPFVEKSPGTLARFMQKDYDNAIRRLRDIPEDCSVNKALCWPLVIIGCYANDKGHQDLIGRRLLHISSHFKVGNALETYHILHDVWTQPAERRSPWLIYKSIRETGCWGNLVAQCLL